MRYSMETQSGIVVVTIHGPWVNDPREFVIHQEVKKALQEGTEAGPRHVILDLKHCTFLASGGIGGLTSIKASTASHGGKVSLCCVSDRVRRALVVSEMWDHFEIHATREEALAALSGGSDNA